MADQQEENHQARATADHSLPAASAGGTTMAQPFTPTDLANLAPMAEAVGFELRDGQFLWTAATPLTAERILSLGGGEEPLCRREAEAFLATTLGDGAKPSKEVIEEARSLGIAEMTLRRAKLALGVRACKQQFSGVWFWALPLAGEDDQPMTKKVTPAEAEHLRRSGGGKGSYANQLGEDAQLASGEHLRQT